MSLKTQIKEITEKFAALLRSISREIKDVDSWDGSASQWPDTDAFCSDCLIDLNSVAGNEEKTQNYCKLPIREPGDSKDVYVRQAAYAAAGALAGARTEMKKPDGVSDSDWDSALETAANKLIEIYNEMDETAPDSVYELAGKEPPEEESQENKRAVSSYDVWWESVVQAWEIDDWSNVIDIYTDDGTQLYAVIASEGKLFRAEVTVNDDVVSLSTDWILVTKKVQFDPVAQNRGSFHIRQTDEGYRWFSVSSSAALNRSGEIDSRDLFDSFIQHAEETGEYPIRQFYHAGDQYKTGQCDFLARDDFLLLSSGLFDDSEIARAEIKARESDPEYWGESIGFFADDPEMFDVSDGIKIPVYNEGICVEISTLPESNAAAWMTNNTALQEVTRMLDEKQMSALVKLFGDDESAAQNWLDENVDPANRAIVESEMLTRSANETVDETESVEEIETEPTLDIEPETESVTEIEIGDDLISQMVDRLAESDVIMSLRSDIETLTGTVAALSDTVSDFIQDEAARSVRTANRLKKLEQGEDEKKSQYLQDIPRAAKTRVTYRPRDPESDETGNPDSNLQDVASSTLEKFPQK